MFFKKYIIVFLFLFKFNDHIESKNANVKKSSVEKYLDRMLTTSDNKRILSEYNNYSESEKNEINNYVDNELKKYEDENYNKNNSKKRKLMLIYYSHKFKNKSPLPYVRDLLISETSTDEEKWRILYFFGYEKAREYLPVIREFVLHENFEISTAAAFSCSIMWDEGCISFLKRKIKSSEKKIHKKLFERYINVIKNKSTVPKGIE
jgi:hypothetical protein